MGFKITRIFQLINSNGFGMEIIFGYFDIGFRDYMDTVEEFGRYIYRYSQYDICRFQNLILNISRYNFYSEPCI